MKGPDLQLTPADLAALFPFFLAVEESLVVAAAGPAWEKFEDPVGQRLADLFVLRRPKLKALTVEGLLEPDQALRVELPGGGLELRVQVRPWGRGVLLLASPVVRSIDELHERGLDFGDLAPHDANGDLLTLIQTQDTSMADARHLLGQLRRRRKRLLEAKAVAEKAQRAAEDAAAARYSFLAAMSHEIRTPLNGVLGMGRLLHGTELDVEQRGFLRALLGSGEALLGVVNDILDFSKIDSGQLLLEDRPMSPRAVADGVQQLLAPSAQAKGLELLTRVHPSVPELLAGDEARVRQILSNLLGNAVKFTAQGQVSLEMDYREGLLSIAVRDTGIGIPSERLPGLFEPFVQVDASTTRRFGGTGLGLSISRRLCVHMGGSLEVTSQTGQGSVFSAHIPAPELQAFAPALSTLPGPVAVIEPRPASRAAKVALLEAEGAQVAAFDSVSAFEARTGDWYAVLLAGMCRTPSGLAPARVVLTVELAEVLPSRARVKQEALGGYISFPGGRAALLASLRGEARAKPRVREVQNADLQGLRVLLVEDNVVNQRVAMVLLERLGCTPCLAVDGARAVALACAQPFDLVLMDCQMPIMDGFEAARRIRAHCGPELPIVAMTASVMPEDRTASREAGMDGFLNKPVDFAELSRTLVCFARPNHLAV